jgi:hypothetical protein
MVIVHINTSENITLAFEQKYTTWGQTRYSSGTTPTTFRYIGQRISNVDMVIWCVHSLIDRGKQSDAPNTI